MAQKIENSLANQVFGGASSQVDNAIECHSLACRGAEVRFHSEGNFFRQFFLQKMNNYWAEKIKREKFGISGSKFYGQNFIISDPKNPNFRPLPEPARS